ncbi:F-box only protein 32-like [Glandiceps talaboti]
MPFLGLDWRAPGQNWVRTRKGWEKLIALRENLNRHIQKLVKHRLLLLNEKQTSQTSDKAEKLFLLPSDKEPISEIENNNCVAMENRNENKDDRAVEQKERDKPLYLLIPRGRSGLHGFINMSEVMTKLDFGFVAKDTRKFNYVCKSLELIITDYFNDVNGTSQKHVFNVIGQIVNYVGETTLNMKRIKCLLKLVEEALKESKYNHVGSLKVWEKKLTTVQKWREELNAVQLPEREDDGEMQLLDLPDDCLRQIIDRISDHRDLVNLGATNYKFNRLCNKENVWRKLCSYHFAEKQIWSALPICEDDVVWQLVYSKLIKQHKRREVYAEQLKLCNRCHSVYWDELQSSSHPCPHPRTDSEDFAHLKGSRDINPQEFLNLIIPRDPKPTRW